MTASKIMDIIFRIPGCDGQAENAVSASTQVANAQKLLKIPKSECPDIWIRLPRHKWPKSWSSMEDRVVSFERNLYGLSLAGLLWERQFEKILLKHGWEKVPNWEYLFAHREKRLFLSVYVDAIKLAGQKQNIDPMWKVLNEEVDCRCSGIVEKDTGISMPPDTNWNGTYMYHICACLVGICFDIRSRSACHCYLVRTRSACHWYS